MKPLKTIFFAILILMSTVKTAGSQLHISGPLSGMLVDTTYIVEGDISVENGDQLIIQAGATLLFESFSCLWVEGILICAGTPDDSIKFLPDYNKWEGIYVEAPVMGASCYVIMEYCEIAIGEPFYGRMITAEANGKIYHCTITGSESGGGIFTTGEVEIVDCLISGCAQVSYWFPGGGIEANGETKVINCVITGNSGVFGGGISTTGDEVLIEGCIISGNSASERGGGIYATGEPTIKNCIITDNSCDLKGGGIYCNGYPAFENCTVSGNSAGDEGGGFYFDDFYSYYSLNIVNTIVEGNAGGGMRFENNSDNVQIEYCDFYDNEGGDFTGAVPPDLGVLCSINVNGDSCDTFHNILLNPLYYTTSGDSAYYLAENSPCIDAGNPDSPPDFDESVADIGAVFFNHYQPVYLSGPLSGVLEKRFYIVEDDISVEAGASLTIEPGAIFMFHDDCQFEVQGFLFAEGVYINYQNNDSIKFVPGQSNWNWGGINFEGSGADSSYLKYCLISGSASSGVHCNGSSPILERCSILNNYAWGTGDLGGGIWLENGSNSMIKWCYIKYNRGNGAGGIYIDGSNPAFVQWNQIHYNISYDGAGAIACVNGAQPEFISGNAYYNTGDRGGGLYCNGCSLAVGIGLHHNFANIGGGLYMEGNSEVILNVWLASNRSYSDGGGIYCVNSNLEVHASPSFNIADGNGGGVYLDNSSFTCLGHDINDNHGVTGKGIYMVNSTALLQDFDFYDNIVGDAAGANGGGIYCESSELYADSVEFDHNGTSGSGGAVYAEASEVVFNRCIFRENYANLSGGGIYAHASDLEIVNCTFDEDSSASGGCLYAEDIQDLMVLNTAMFETEGNNVIYFDHCQNSSVTYCDFYNTMANFAGNYPAGIGVLTSTNFNGDSCDVYFNIFEEPEFTSWWYYPTPQSPFIDAGDPDSPPDPDGTIADIGAYCYSGVIINVPGDYPTIQAAIDAAFNHDTVLVDDGTYTGPGNKNLDFGGKSIVVKSDNTISTCIIDCQNEGRGCYFHSGENSHAILSGFTIVNGLAEDGGAIYCAGSSPVVRQCVIRDNQAQRGGGIFCGENSGISVENCTLTRNSASTGGSAVYFDSSDATVVNTIVVENGGIAAVEFYYSEAQITYSDFDDNPLGNFSGQIPPGLGNVSSVNANGDSCDIYCNIYLEPQFMDPVHNNFQLQESSPCVDAGNPDPQYNDPQDPENPGYAFPPARGTVVSDMGAFGGTVPGWVEVNPLSPQDIRPQKFILHPNYPNPFNPITIISFELKSPGYVELVIYNINGREVARLVDGTMSAGSYKITFDGSRLSSGIYFARLNAGGFEQIQKLLLIK